MAVQIIVMISVNNSLISFLTFGSLCSERQHCLSLGKKRHRHYLDMYISSVVVLQIQSTPAIQMSLHLDFDRAESQKFFFRGSMTRSTTNFDITRSSQFAKVFSHGILLTILPARSSQSCGKAQCIGENRNFYRAHHMFSRIHEFFSLIFLSWKGNLYSIY